MMGTLLSMYPALLPLMALVLVVGGVHPSFAETRAGAGAPLLRGARGGKPGASGQTGRAKSLLEQGIAALQGNDLPLATRLLEDSYRMSPRPEVLFHLGRIAQSASRLIAAQDLFRRYMADPTREPDEAAARTVEEILSQTLPATGSVIILSDPGGLVLIDSRVVGTLPLPLPLLLSAETHSIALEFPGKKLDAPVQVLPDRTSELRISRTSGAVLVSLLPAILLSIDSGDLPAPARKALADVLDQSVHGEQHTTLATAAALARAPELKSCLAKDACLRQLAQKNNLEFLLIMKTQAKPAAKEVTWKMDAALLRTDIEEPAAQATMECAQCTLDAALARMKDGSAKLLSEGLSRPRAQVHITATPAAAELRIGARNPTASPYDATLWAGTYELLVKHPGYRTERRSFDVAEGQKAALDVQLEKEQAAEAAAVPNSRPRSLGWVVAPRPKWRLALGGVFIGLGLGLVGLGAVGIVRDGQCLEPPEIPGAMCPEVHNTLGAGAAGIAIGGALATIGTVLLALPGPRQKVEGAAQKPAM